MRYFIMLLVLIIASPALLAEDIKIIKSDAYNKSLAANAITINPKPAPMKKKIRDLYPLLVPKKPNLNGKFSQQLAYKNGQRKIKTHSDDQ